MAIRNIVATMTALEVARRSSNPDAFTIIETMSMSNTMLQELPAAMANDGAVHTTLKRLSYPHGEHRIYNRGVGKKASQTEPVRDWITMLEAYSDVDVAQARHSGNPTALYQSEAMAFLVGMGEDQAEDLIYGNHNKNPEEIDGLAVRYPKINGKSCIDFGGTATNNTLTSIYLIAAGPQSCQLIYPKGSNSVGVERKDAGEMYVDDPQTPGKQYLAHRDHFKAEYGITVAHPDAVIRIANIDANLDQAGRKKLINLVLQYQRRLTKGVVNTVLFGNSEIVFQVEQAGREAQLVLHPEADPWGKPVTSINGMRFREQDAILYTEGKVV